MTMYGCICGYSGWGEGTPVSSCVPASDEHCCQYDDGSCGCNSVIACGGIDGGTLVPSCSPANVECSGSFHSVSLCQ
jgi:hypothetical protein